MQQLLIKPIDSLLFRDGKPFQSGESHRAISIFPPSPSVFAGFLRSKILTENCNNGNIDTAWEKVKDIIGEKGKDPKFEIKGIMYKIGNEYYFPTPLDIVKEKSDEDNGKYYVLSPDNAPKEVGYKTNFNLNLPFPPKEILNVEQAKKYISQDELKKYMQVNFDFNQEKFIKDNDIYQSENKVGIAVDSKTNTTKEHNLYTASFLRFKENFKFVILIDKLNYNFEAYNYYIGGEKRQVKFEIENNFNFNLNLKTKKLKLILITPAYTNTKEPLTNKLNEILNNKKGKLKYVCLRTEQIGGFDILNQKPKPIENLLSVGSVFYIELENEVDISDLNFESISDKDEKLGFGRIIAGKW